MVFVFTFKIEYHIYCLILSDYRISRRFFYRPPSDVSARTENWHVYGAIIEMSWFNRHQAGMISGFIISTNHVPVKYYMYRIIKTAIYFQLPAKSRPFYCHVLPLSRLISRFILVILIEIVYTWMIYERKATADPKPYFLRCTLLMLENRPINVTIIKPPY